MLKLTANLVAEYLAGNAVASSDVPNLIRGVYQALAEAGQKPAVAEAPVPAVPIKKSVAAGHVVCLECGRRLTMLKRHLTVDHGLTLGDYRTKWGLPADHPLVAPDYAEKRSALAHKSGLGTKRKKDSAPAEPVKNTQGAAPVPAVLPGDHPLVAPDQAKKRSVLTLKLGSKRKKDAVPAEVAGDRQVAGPQEPAPVPAKAEKRGFSYPANQWSKPRAG